MKEALTCETLKVIIPQTAVDGVFLTSPAMVGSNRRIIGL